MGIEPWPADGDAATDGDALLENGGVAGENNGGLVVEAIIRQVGAMQRDACLGMGIANPDHRVAGSQFLKPYLIGDTESPCELIDCLHGDRKGEDGRGGKP